MVVTRLSGLDTAFLSLDSASTPMNIGALALFAPTHSVHPTRLADLLRERAERIPRLRQRVRTSVLRPGVARWVDDPGFDVTEHVHIHHLPRPHDGSQLTDHVADIMSERLHPGRPLWELHVITGLPGGWFALLPKLHHALADGAGALALGLGLLDGLAAVPRPRTATTSRPGLGETLRALGSSMDIAGAVLRNTRPALPASPLLAPNGGARTLATARLDMHDIKRIRRRHGGTTNDVLLAVLSGALRKWLLARGDRPDALSPRALVPVSQRCRTKSSAGNQLSGYLCDLPVSEPDPVRRLMAVRAMMDGNKEAGPGRGPGAVPMLADRLPSALHRVFMPMVGRCAPLLCDTVVTTVPLPSVPLRFDGAELREIYPVVPLAPGHALGVAFSPYRDTVHVGLTANADALPDIDLLANALSGTLCSLHELCA
jgi:diacylglycerol O-acyltransferase / wax synthase